MDITVSQDMCGLITRLHDVFNILRTMAFIGAAFYMAAWAWKYIQSGEAKVEDLKKQSIGLIAGFTLLFAVGLVVSFVMSAAGMNMLGCDILKTW